MEIGHSFIILNTPPPPRRIVSCSTAIRPFVAISADSQIQRVKLAESLQFETFKILEWPSVCNQISAFVSTSMGLDAADTASIPLGLSPVESKRLLAQTSAAVAVSRPLDFSGIKDVSAVVDVLVSGEILSVGEFCSAGRTLRSAPSLLKQLEEISSSGDSVDRYAEKERS